MGRSILAPLGRCRIMFSLIKVMKLAWLASIENGPVSLREARALILPSKRVFSGEMILAENTN